MGGWNINSKKKWHPSRYENMKLVKEVEERYGGDTVCMHVDNNRMDWMVRTEGEYYFKGKFTTFDKNSH